MSIGVPPAIPDGSNPSRVVWLDGLRGIAAIQVVLLHYASAFLPGIGLLDPALIHYDWETIFIRTPLFVPFDGYSAVYIFFVLSGVSLTYAFSRQPVRFLRNILRRIVRLGLPMAGATLLAAIWFAMWPDAHVRAGTITRSLNWLAAGGPATVSAGSLLHQIGLEGMFAGYAGISVLPARIQSLLGLIPLMTSFDAPLWSLHIELAGSVMILGLVMLKDAIRPPIYTTVCVILLFMLSASFLGLFIVGHLAARWLRTPSSRRSNPMLGSGLVCLGILLCTSKTMDVFEGLRWILPGPFLGRWEYPGVVQPMYGAVALFFGICWLPRLQVWLGVKPVRWFGKISFSLYLTHWPILFTVVSACFVAGVPHASYSQSIFMATMAGFGISILAAGLFEMFIDRPSIQLSRKFGAGDPVVTFIKPSPPRTREEQ